MQTSFICVCKYLNQRVIKIGEQNVKHFNGVKKKKKKKKAHEEIEFNNSIQD